MQSQRISHITNFSIQPVYRLFMQISVVIPTYNRCAVICRSIDSVLRQTRPPNEIIVIDDGSTDDTLNKLEAQYSDQITVIEIPKNAGVSAARNVGIKYSHGDWIALLDSDDEWLETKLATQEQALQQDSHLLCHTEEIWIRNGKRVNPMNKHAKQGGDIFEVCLPLCAISPSSVLIHKDLFDQIGNFDESLPACEDYDLWLRICSRHSVLFVETPQLLKYGGHADQLSRQHWGMDRFRVTALQKILQSNALNPQQRQLAISCILQKSQILYKGALKHNNPEMIDLCQSLLQQYSYSTQSTPGDEAL